MRSKMLQFPMDTPEYDDGRMWAANDEVDDGVSDGVLAFTVFASGFGLGVAVGALVLWGIM